MAITGARHSLTIGYAQFSGLLHQNALLFSNNISQSPGEDRSHLGQSCLGKRYISRNHFHRDSVYHRKPELARRPVPVPEPWGKHACRLETRLAPAAQIAWICHHRSADFGAGYRCQFHRLQCAQRPGAATGQCAPRRESLHAGTHLRDGHDSFAVISGLPRPPRPQPELRCADLL